MKTSRFIAATTAVQLLASGPAKADLPPKAPVVGEIFQENGLILDESAAETVRQADCAAARQKSEAANTVHSQAVTALAQACEGAPAPNEECLTVIKEKGALDGVCPPKTIECVEALWAQKDAEETFARAVDAEEDFCRP